MPRFVISGASRDFLYTGQSAKADQNDFPKEAIEGAYSLTACLP